MKKTISLFTLAFAILLVSSCHSSKKTTKTKEGSTAKNETKKSTSKTKGGEKVTLDDYLEESVTPTGITPFDQFNSSSFDLAKSIQNLAKEANMLIVLSKEVPDATLGTKTVVTCYSNDTLPGSEKPCNLINKKEALSKFATILQNTVNAANSATTLINQATSLPTELTALAKSNPSLALKVPKAVKKLGETAKLLKIALAETGNIGSNVKSSVAALNKIKEQ